VKKLVASILLVPSLALAQPSAYVPPPAPLPELPANLPTSPIIAMPAGGYMVLPMEPENPSHTRKVVGGITLAAGIGLVVLGGLLLANRPSVPALGAPGWFDAQSTSDGDTLGGVMLIGAGVSTAIVGGLLLAVPDQPYGELRGTPMLTF
jgi:hypothetical protein